MKSLLLSPTKTDWLPKLLAVSAFLRKKAENLGVWTFLVSSSEVIHLAIRPPHTPAFPWGKVTLPEMTHPFSFLVLPSSGL